MTVAPRPTVTFRLIALDDALAVTRALIARGRVAVAGDSAGGNLAASVANLVPVAGQFLMYPVTDCADERPSHEIYGTGHVLTREAIRYFRREYVPVVAQRHESGASPVRASSLAQSAPAYLVIAQCDVVRDEGVAYAGRLQEAGVDVTLDEVPARCTASCRCSGCARPAGHSGAPHGGFGRGSSRRPRRRRTTRDWPSHSAIGRSPDRD